MSQTSATPNPAGTAGLEEAGPQEVLRILTDHRGDRGGLIAILEGIQERYGYLPENALRMVAEETGRSLVDVYGIATFYRAFSLTPRGRHLVCACLGTACHVRGAPAVVEELQRQLGIRAGQTTPDGEFTFETVNCLGACALGPIVVIDGRYFPKMRRAKVRHVLDEALAGVREAGAGEDGRVFPLEVSCPRCNHSLMDGGTLVDGLPSVRVVLVGEGAVGPCYLSSLYGSPGMVCEVEVPEGTVCGLFCPRCHSDLAGASLCGDCGASTATLGVRGGGMVCVCRRRGCHARRLDLEGVNV